MNKKYITIMSLCAAFTMAAQAPADTTGNAWLDQPIDIGGDVNFTRAQSTAAVSVIVNDQIDRRSAKNIGNDILGQGSGLISLQGAGRYAVENPTFYVRGLQTLSDNNAPLILIDGIERDINQLSAEEVQSVSILKDATATALYGYKAVNGAILITTKRGKANSQQVIITYDHGIQERTHTPKFVDAFTYASAVNEARSLNGQSAAYNANELAAYKSGQYPYYYPNVNWVDEVFRDKGATNKYSAQFVGGGERFRYYAALNLLTSNGYIKRPNENEGYSTQDKFGRGNLRMNLDIDLTPTTLVKVNVFGSLQETSQPGNAVDLWNLMYSVPSLGMPIKAESGLWGGSTTWVGTSNPVAQAEGAGYYRNHQRLLYTDVTIRQDLKGLTPGLAAQLRVSYDNIANIYENHSKTYLYTNTNVTWPEGAEAPTATFTNEGEDSALGSDAKTNTFDRRLHVDVGLDYTRKFGDFDTYGQLKWDFESNDPNGINNTVYRQNISFWGHAAYKNRYMLDLTLVESGSSRLAPGTKWSFAPTLGLGWVISNESFWSDPTRFLKLRATAGQVNADYLPDGSWTYYVQQYSTSGGTYPFTDGWSSEFGRTELGQMATENPNHERAYKYNIGIDAQPVEGLNVSLDLFKERRSNIWVSTAGRYSALIGMTAPWENLGKVDSKGLELSLDYSKTLGDFSFSLGGNFDYYGSKIKYQAEAPQLYDNLYTTGHPVGQIFGYIAEGIFQNQAEITAAPTQNLGSVVRPGDIRYRDVNNDGVIDTNDRTAIGHSTTAPEIFYNFRLGAEYKGFGVYAMFQGTGKYSAMLNTSFYSTLVGTNSLTQYVYDNRWTGEGCDSEFPRLSPNSNANNTVTSTFWLRDRSFLKLRNLEVYYNVPQAWLKSNLKVVNGLKIYFRGDDLFTTSKVPENDPECYGNIPVNRQFAVGARVTF